MARAIWKGRIILGDDEVPVKMYSAVEDRKVHFRLVRAKDLSPIHQRIVRKSDGKEIAKDEQRKAYVLDPETAVIVQPDELQSLQPRPSREIDVCRFVAASALGDQWYDRPYYLGPDGEDASYFALAEAVAKSGSIGIARWVMRRKRYVGALRSVDGYLMMITLRRAEQVLSVAGVDVPRARAPDAREVRLAQQLVESIADDFEPEQWHDEYRERVCALIEAKAKGRPVRTAPAPRRSSADLAERLRQSLAAARERKVA